MQETRELIGLFITLAGFVIGQGAVTVIDIHGFLGRKSEYWTEATTRTHKVTKPLIWLGIILVSIGLFVFYPSEAISLIPKIHAIIIGILILNGCFLSFVISPYLINKEKDGRSRELLPQKMQNKIVFSFIVSFTLWWSALFLFAYYLIYSRY